MQDIGATGPARKLRVLVVEDDDVAREGIAVTLRGLDCDVVEVAESTQAVEAFLNDSFDLITLDYRMPGINGMELHAILSQEFGAGKRVTGPAPKTLPPIVIITGYPDSQDVVEGRLGEGIAAVIPKPEIGRKLSAVVTSLRKA